MNHKDAIGQDIVEGDMVAYRNGTRYSRFESGIIVKFHKTKAEIFFVSRQDYTGKHHKNSRVDFSSIVKVGNSNGNKTNDKSESSSETG